MPTCIICCCFLCKNKQKTTLNAMLSKVQFTFRSELDSLQGIEIEIHD
jgi:hypothetical protein